MSASSAVPELRSRQSVLWPLLASLAVLAVLFGGKVYSDWREVKDYVRLEDLRVRIMEVRDGLGGVLAPFGGPGMAWERAWDTDPWLEYGSDLTVEPEDDPFRKWVYNMGIGNGAMGEEYAADQVANAVVDYLTADGWRVGDDAQRPGYMSYIKHDELGGWGIEIRYTTEPPPAEQHIYMALGGPYLFEK